MNNAELRRLLQEAGFTCEPKKDHELWRHPTGVWTMLRHGSRAGERRRAMSVRSAIRKAQRAHVAQ